MGDVAAVVAVTGLRREGRVLRNAGVAVVAGGGDAAGLAARLERAADGAAGLISFGMAGALDPALRLGDWIVGRGVTGGYEAACDPAWAAALHRLLPAATPGLVHADGRLAATSDAKRLLGRQGALAVDMESHVVAAAAARAGIPFAILRCISDEAGAALPPAVAAAMKPGGGLDPVAVARSMLSHPRQLADLLRTAVRFNRAYGALAAGARAAGPRLGFDRREAG